jgi:Kyakuja-Dileera-Zisupton transposase
MNALLATKACDVTGLVAIACAHHGCYAPNSLVNLFLGEGQRNMDFSLLRAIFSTNINPDQGLLLIYDIICQYIIHLLDRIGFLLPEGLQVDAAIGLFHVHAHKDDCFFRFAPTFIPGSGVVAGEILESLWSSLNSISPSAHTATLGHRADIIDNHATDSNHKKMLGMVSTLCKNHVKAVNMCNLAYEYYEGVTNQAGPIAVSKWRMDIEAAEDIWQHDRSAMDIYAAKNPMPSSSDSVPVNNDGSALKRWMSLSMLVEDKQSVLSIIV